jgi:flagellar biosynthetic protein FliP
MGRIALIALFALASVSPAAAADAIAGAGGLSNRVVEIFIAVTVLSLAPGIAMMATCLPLIVIVLSILRQGAGLQQSPPNMMIMGVALFLTWFVMEPVFADAWTAGVRPMLDGAVDQREGLARAATPFSDFMRSRVNDATLATLAEARGDIETLRGNDPPLSLLAPAFALSEIQRAFQIGFVVLLPFLVIDLLIASILMAMGMMMVPPAAVALPFKLAFFVLTNGWVAVSAALVRSYG